MNEYRRTGKQQARDFRRDLIRQWRETGRYQGEPYPFRIRRGAKVLGISAVILSSAAITHSVGNGSWIVSGLVGGGSGLIATALTYNK